MKEKDRKRKIGKRRQKEKERDRKKNREKEKEEKKMKENDRKIEGKIQKYVKKNVIYFNGFLISRQRL